MGRQKFLPSYCRNVLPIVFAMLMCLCGYKAQAQFGRIGTGTSVNTATTYPTPFGAYYSGQRAQYLYLSNELTAAGLSPGAITAIAFYVTALNGAGAHDTFSIALGQTIITNLSTWAPTSTVYRSNRVRPTPGWNIFQLQYPFVWNGTANIVMEICHWNGASTSTFNASVLGTGTGGIASINAYSHTARPCVNNSLTPNVYYSRPDILIGNIPACTGRPSAGTLVPSGTLVACPLTTYDITAVNYTIARNTSFRWKQSTDGGATWLPAVGGSGDTTFNYTTPSLTLDSIRYHMVITCPTSGLSDSTADVVFRITQPVYAPLPFSESFENWISRCDTSEVPSIYWTNAPYTGNRSWRRDDSGTAAGWAAPGLGAYTPAAVAGLHSARFHAHESPAGGTGEGSLLAYLDCSSIAGAKDLTFFMRTDTGRLQPADSLFVDLSLNGGAVFTTIGAFGPGTGGWDLKIISIASDSPKTVIRFRAFSQFPLYSDIGIDSVSVMPPVPAGIASAHAPVFRIYPNPAGGQIHIRSGNGGIVEVADMLGRRVKTIVLPGRAGTKVVDLEGIPAGLYTYRYLDDGMHQAAIGKLMIIH